MGGSGPTSFVIVAAPSLVGPEPPTDLNQLTEYPWLQELGTNEVSNWMASQGVIPRHALNMTDLPGYLVLDGLRRGDGISATARAFVEDEIARGELILLSEDIRPASGYYIVTRPGVLRPPLKAFTTWLRRQVSP